MEQVRKSDGSPMKYLYRRVHVSKDGKRTTRYCARFVDWQGIRRCFALGADLARARVTLHRWLDKNAAEVDFDALKVERAARGMTLSRWAAENVRKVNADHVKHLNSFFGDTPLAHISDSDVEKYREKRSTEKLIRGKKKTSKTTVSQSTINKEVSTLRTLLILARKQGINSKVTTFPMEKEFARSRVLDAGDYRKLLDSSDPLWLRRAIIMAYETSLSRGDILGLTWDQIDLAQGVIKRKRNKTAVEHIIPIATPELITLVEELKGERRKIPNAAGLVFTIDGHAMSKNVFEYQFVLACKRAGIKDFHFHDLRHCAITRWAAAGIPTAPAMQAAGHSSVASHKKYQNLQLDQLKSAFQKLSQPRHNEKMGRQDLSITA
jgi:integrase